MNKSVETKKLKEAIIERIDNAWREFEKAVDAAEESDLVWGYDNWPIYELKEVMSDCEEQTMHLSSSSVVRKESDNNGTANRKHME